MLRVMMMMSDNWLMEMNWEICMVLFGGSLGAGNARLVTSHLRRCLQDTFTAIQKTSVHFPPARGAIVKKQPRRFGGHAHLISYWGSGTQRLFFE